MPFDDPDFPPPTPRRRSRPIDEDPDPADLTRASGDFIPCPRCRKLIFEDAEQCPYCKHFVAHAARRRQPRWVVYTIVLAIILMILFFVLNLPMPFPLPRPDPFR